MIISGGAEHFAVNGIVLVTDTYSPAAAARLTYPTDRFLSCRRGNDAGGGGAADKIHEGPGLNRVCR